jgi:hypothetical protein
VAASAGGTLAAGRAQFAGKETTNAQRAEKMQNTALIHTFPVSRIFAVLCSRRRRRRREPMLFRQSRSAWSHLEKEEARLKTTPRTLNMQSVP